VEELRLSAKQCCY